MNTLDAYMSKNNITKFDFSNAIGVSRQSVYKWLRGEAMPTPCNIRIIHKTYPDLDILAVVRDIVSIILQS